MVANRKDRSYLNRANRGRLNLESGWNGMERIGLDRTVAILASSISVLPFYQLTSKTAGLSVRLLVDFVSTQQN